jgi:glyoxylase-like metal-dependent hydrolase (beta-lactamase superfamily II)
MSMKPLALAVLLVIALSVDADAQDARTVIDDASRAMGAAGVNSITYSGIAAVANFGQSRTISFGLASATIRNYTRTIDFTQPASRVTGYVVPPAIQGGPPIGELEEVIGAGETSWPRQLEIWITPWGFLRGAAAGAATVKSQKIDGTAYKVVSWTPGEKAPSGQSYRLVGYINPQNLVDRVETWAEHPILGDLHIDTRYSNYLDAGGLKFPSRVTQRRVGMEVFVAAIAAARADPPELAQLIAASPRTGASAAPAAPVVASEKLADGVYVMTGGYTALAVELRDYAVVLGGGGPESYGQALLAEVKRLMPKKPIRYVVNTHPHFDHAAVLPPFAAEGITILTDDPNRYFLEQALASPRTLVGDALAKSRRRPKVEGVVDKLVLGDNARSIELRHLPKFEHSDGMLVAYLPNEKILLTADVDEGAPALSALQLSVERHIMVRPPNEGGQ